MIMSTFVTEESREGRSYLVDNKSGKSVKLKKSSKTYTIYERKGKHYVAAGKSDSEPLVCAELLASQGARGTSESKDTKKKSTHTGKESETRHRDKSKSIIRKTPKRRCKEKTSPTRAAKTPPARVVAPLKGMAGPD